MTAFTGSSNVFYLPPTGSSPNFDNFAPVCPQTVSAALGNLNDAATNTLWARGPHTFSITAVTHLSFTITRTDGGSEDGGSFGAVPQITCKGTCLFLNGDFSPFLAPGFFVLFYTYPFPPESRVHESRFCGSVVGVVYFHHSIRVNLPPESCTRHPTPAHVSAHSRSNTDAYQLHDAYCSINWRFRSRVCSRL